MADGGDEFSGGVEPHEQQCPNEEPHEDHIWYYTFVFSTRYMHCAGVA